jgi:hypothetical protein
MARFAALANRFVFRAGFRAGENVGPLPAGGELEAIGRRTLKACFIAGEQALQACMVWASTNLGCRSPRRPLPQATVCFAFGKKRLAQRFPWRQGRRRHEKTNGTAPDVSISPGIG